MDQWQWQELSKYLIEARTFSIENRSLLYPPLLHPPTYLESVIAHVHVNGQHLLDLLLEKKRGDERSGGSVVTAPDAGESVLSEWQEIQDYSRIRACRYGETVFWVPNLDWSHYPWSRVLISIPAELYETELGGDSSRLRPLTDAEFTYVVNSFLEFEPLRSHERSQFCIPPLCDDASGRFFTQRLNRALLNPSEPFSVATDIAESTAVMLGYDDRELEIELGKSAQGGCVRFTSPVKFPIWITNNRIRALCVEIGLR